MSSSRGTAQTGDGSGGADAAADSGSREPTGSRRHDTRWAGRERPRREGADAEPVEESEAFRLLGNDRRRAVLRQVADDGGSTLSEVATHVAATETAETADDDAAAGGVDKSLYKSVYVSLQQTHLPKLDDAGVVDYDTETNEIRPGPRLDDVRAYLHPSPRLPSRPSVRAVLAASLLGLLSVVASGLGVPAISAVSAGVWSVLSLTVVTLGLALTVTGVVD
ncbi:hypothetical protein ACFO0N_02425 [Halobium salinum]|uniref:DUF7344 domain-containing protein n=1 Tax=Halobium salinum TaxID=1364940 RepID=A0ABD5P7U1_9EURY|nr:hypothetical protein [Halobium salinum]